ncbi:MAG: hypothetical protein WCY09_09170 [Candidatus Omnitrophota bacterium]
MQQGFILNGKQFIAPPEEGDHWLCTDKYNFLEVRNSDYILVVPKVKKLELSGEEVNKNIKK